MQWWLSCQWEGLVAVSEEGGSHELSFMTEITHYLRKVQRITLHCGVVTTKETP